MSSENRSLVFFVLAGQLGSGKPSKHLANQHCVNTYGSHTRWMGSWDTDEFMWPVPRGKTLFDVLEDQDKINKGIGGFHIQCSRFGRMGVEARLNYSLSLSDDGRKLPVLHNPCGLQFVTQMHQFRMPDKRINAKERSAQQAMEASDACKIKSSWDLCDQGPGKSIYRPEKIVRERYDNLHYVSLKQGRTPWISMSAVRCYHFYLRSRQDAEFKAAFNKKRDPLDMIKHGTDELFTTVADSALWERYGEQLEERVGRLLPPNHEEQEDTQGKKCEGRDG
jgi:hypothetical protein